MSREIGTEGTIKLLSDVPPGGRVLMVGFMCQGRRAHRLAEMGINPGTEIKVLQADSGQPIMLKVRGSQLAIDRREATQLVVTPVEPMPEIPRLRRRRGLRGRRRCSNGRGR